MQRQIIVTNWEIKQQQKKRFKGKNFQVICNEKHKREAKIFFKKFNFAALFICPNYWLRKKFLKKKAKKKTKQIEMMIMQITSNLISHRLKIHISLIVPFIDCQYSNMRKFCAFFGFSELIFTRLFVCYENLRNHLYASVHCIFWFVFR